MAKSHHVESILLTNAISKPFQQSKCAGGTNLSLLGPCLDKLLACANCSSCNWFSMSTVMTTQADTIFQCCFYCIKISQVLANPQVGRTSSCDAEERTTVIVISWHMDAKLMCRMNAKHELLIQSDLLCYTAMLQYSLFVTWSLPNPTQRRSKPHWIASLGIEGFCCQPPDPNLTLIPQVSPPMQINVRNSSIL